MFGEAQPESDTPFVQNEDYEEEDKRQGVWAVHRVAHLIPDLGLVDLEFNSSTIRSILPSQMGIWQKGR